MNTVITIAYRDIVKFLRDRSRIFATFIFPLIFIGVLGGSLQSNLSDSTGFSFLAFVFTGALAQTLFQSSSSGIISLIEDRENDFAQEMFVAPVSRYAIILGKILGESIVSLIQGIGIIIFALVLGIEISSTQMALLIPGMIVACLFGGSFGVLVLSQLNNQRGANQLFPFLIFPQFFLAGTFTPITNLPLPLWILSRIAPMTYAVDFLRGLFYLGKPEYSKIVLHHPMLNLMIMSVLFFIFIIVGTYFFVKKDQER